MNFVAFFFFFAALDLIITNCIVRFLRYFEKSNFAGDERALVCARIPRVCVAIRALRGARPHR